MRFSCALVFAACLATEATAAPVAISCDAVVTTTYENFTPFPDGTTTKQSNYVFVIDDAKKTLQVYDDKSVSLKDWCSDCDYTFGATSISYSKMSNATRPEFKLATTNFRLDRVGGTVSWVSKTFGSRNGRTENYRYDTSIEGPCKRVAMPKLTSPSAKF